MLHPTFINLVHFFYATGNTSAAYLLETHAKEQSANVLLLGCGDPRNILFTAYCAQDDGPRKIDFTCCDIEPGLLARNVLLFSLLLDKSKELQARKYWNIFYHLLLDPESLSLVHSQAKKLADLSVNIATWHSSKYGSILRMVSVDTLSQLHDFWGKYRGAASLGGVEKEAFENRFKAGWDKVSKDYDLTEFKLLLHGARSAGPLWRYALEATSQQFRRYWATGVAGGNTVDVDAAKHANPLFAFSSAAGNEFTVHYGTDPLLGFHLETAFTDLLSSGPFHQGSQLPGESEPDQLADRAVQAAKAQFRAWCKAFSVMATKKKIKVRFFLGDALRFCSALELGLAHFTTGKVRQQGFAQPWRTTPLQLDGGDYYCTSDSHTAPVKFDVIETSNLADHVGLVNLLVSTTPLLSYLPMSVLYTETLLRSSEDETTQLSSLLCGDIPTMALLLGVAPVGYLTATSARASAQEAVSYLGSVTNSGTQLHSRVSWKAPLLGDIAATKCFSEKKPRCSFTAEGLARVLFTVYLNMFEHENLSNLMKKFKGISKGMSVGLFHYTRMSFVALVRVARTQVDVDWEKAMELLIERITDDQELLLGRNGIQELFLYMHLMGVYTQDPPLKSNPRISAASVTRPPAASNFTGILAEPSPSPVVCVVLIVPRAKLDFFTNMKRTELGTPSISGSIRGPGFHNAFASINAAFGKLVRFSGGRYGIAESADGWMGKADMIVSFWVPTFMLLTYLPKLTEVCLELQSSIGNSRPQFIRHLGHELIIHRSPLSDKEHTFVLNGTPGLISSPEFRTVTLTPPPSLDPAIPNPGVKISNVMACFDKSSCLDGLRVHLDYSSAGLDKEQLSGGAVLQFVQDSPCTLILKIGEAREQPLAFPFPINASRRSVKIARKSSWIEIVVPPSTPLDKAGYTLSLYPALHGEYPVLWDIPRVNLGRLPVLDISKPENTKKWLDPHMSSMWSDRERKIRDRGGESDIKTQLKESLYLLFMHTSGNGQGAKTQIFSINCDGDGGIQIFIFVTNLCLDFSSRTVVADCYVLPLEDGSIASLMPEFRQLLETKFLAINVTLAELECWKELLAVAVERCRDWEHKPGYSCEYRTDGIPVTSEGGKTPFCSCGVGRVELSNIPKAWGPFAKYLIRAAIGPLFPAPYAESTMGIFKDVLNSVFTGFPPPPGSGAREVENACEGCGLVKEGLLKCGRCKKTKYCSVECQKSDWKKHKTVCAAK